MFSILRIFLDTITGFDLRFIYCERVNIELLVRIQKKMIAYSEF